MKINPLLCLCALALPAAAAPKNAMKHPNIIFVLADDTGYGDVSAHGNPILKTPNLDRLHDQSVRFGNFHVSPTCSPTRSALLTGRHEFKNGVTHTILERERLTLDAVTLPQVLKSAGYSTGIFGKWHLGDEAAYQPNRRGFDEVFIHGGGGIGQTYPGSCGDAPGNKYLDPVILHNGTFEKTSGFCTDVFFAQAMRWVGEKRLGAAPFFCYVPLNAAHEPVSCPPEWSRPYEGKVPDKVATFYGMIANIDSNVGAILTKLDEWGIANDTLVIFMNDNGGSLGTSVFNAGMRGSKGSPWEGGTRAATFWRWPGTLKPHEVSALTAHIDFFPTLAELAGARLGAKARAQNEGRSLAPLLRGEKVVWPNRELFTHVGRWPKGADPEKFKYAQCSVRDESWHLVSDSKGEKHWQLFYVQGDPGEKTDVAAAHPDVVARLDAAYDKWWASVVPMMVNEKAVGPEINPFKELYWKQFTGPGPNNVPREPLMGAIRWDAWYGADGPVTAVEKSLGPPKYHFRLPWFATVTGEATVKINGDRPEIMAREIEWAATAGLDYWAFVDYGDSGAMSRGLRNYLATDDKRGVKFCFVEEGGRLDGSDLTQAWPRLVGHFQRADYQKVLDGRPLLFVFGPPKKLGKQQFDDLAERCLKAGLPRPYLVFMGWNPEADNKTRSQLGFDAVSAYGAHGAYDKKPPSFADLVKGVEQGRWETCSRLKIPCVTFATSGWDTRPRMENPPPWIIGVKADPDPTPPAQQTPLRDSVTATPEQLAAHLKNAVTWTNANRDINPSNAILIYAWNENDEGGWLMPTRGSNGEPDDSRIVAVRSVLR